ncbi:uncharacterized protein JCM10292_001147 [Rhodotorula paludigena]|uniref:uncharacterized protein n=1 Tax=Rhodotorula paludigena TaxID=86838 RepID=UPI00317D657E
MISLARRTAQAVGGMTTSTPRLDPTTQQSVSVTTLRALRSTIKPSQNIDEQQSTLPEVVATKSASFTPSIATDSHSGDCTNIKIDMRISLQRLWPQIPRLSLAKPVRTIKKAPPNISPPSKILRQHHHRALLNARVERMHAHRNLKRLKATRPADTAAISEAEAHVEAADERLRHHAAQHALLGREEKGLRRHLPHQLVAAHACEVVQQSEQHVKDLQGRVEALERDIERHPHDTSAKRHLASAQQELKHARQTHGRAKAHLDHAHAHHEYHDHLASAHLLTHHHHKVERLEKIASSGSASERQAAAKKLKKQRDKLTQHEKYHTRLLVQHPHLAEKTLDTRIQSADHKVHADHEHLARAEHELQQDPKRADLQARPRVMHWTPFTNFQSKNRRKRSIITCYANIMPHRLVASATSDVPTQLRAQQRSARWSDMLGTVQPSQNALWLRHKLATRSTVASSRSTSTRFGSSRSARRFASRGGSEKSHARPAKRDTGSINVARLSRRKRVGQKSGPETPKAPRSDKPPSTPNVRSASTRSTSIASFRPVTATPVRLLMPRMLALRDFKQIMLSHLTTVTARASCMQLARLPKKPGTTVTI